MQQRTLTARRQSHLKKIVLYILLSGVLLASGCGGGIEPEPERPIQMGFGGTVTFTGTWNPDIMRVHLVVFRSPLNSVADFNPFNLAFVSDSIPIGATTWSYNTNENKISDIFNLTAGSYAYAAVAFSTTPDLALDRGAWFVVGVYRATGDTASVSPVVIPEGQFVSGVNIFCDFDNPPPQPPE